MSALITPSTNVPIVKVVPLISDPVVLAPMKICCVVASLYTILPMAAGNTRFEYCVRIAPGSSGKNMGAPTVSLKKGTVPFQASVMLVFCS